MTKLHYFNRASADPDDSDRAFAVQWGLVPFSCLLGGLLLHPILAQKQDPCRTCNGPRDRCGGRPRATQEQLHDEVAANRMRSILLGDEESPIDQLLKRR